MSLSNDYDGFSLEVFGNRDFELEFSILVDGVPFSGGIASWQGFWFTAKRSLTDGDNAAILSMSLTGGGIVLTDPAGSLGKVVVRSDDYQGLVSGEPVKCWCELLGKDPAGKLRTLQTGTIQINPTVNRDVV